MTWVGFVSHLELANPQGGIQGCSHLGGVGEWHVDLLGCDSESEISSSTRSGLVISSNSCISM